MELNSTSLLNDSYLEGYWRLEDATDSSSNGYDLTNNSGSFVAGKYSNAVDLENSGGEDQYLSIADASCPDLEISGSQSWSAWIKPETLGNASIMNKRYDATNVDKRILLLGTGAVQFRLSGLTTNESVSTEAGVISTGNWYHVCGVYNSSEGKLKIFVNTAKTEVDASGTATDTNGAFAIGRSGGYDFDYFDGIIDDCAIFSRALTDSEVSNLFALGVGVSDSVTISESFTPTLISLIGVSDSAEVSESISPLLVHLISKTDSVTISEYVDSTIREGNDLNISIWKDNITITDTPEFPGPRDAVLEESITVTEKVTVKLSTPTSDTKPAIRVEN